MDSTAFLDVTYSTTAEELRRILARRVRLARMLNDITQQELADDMGVARSVVARLETAEQLVSLEILLALGRTLTIPLAVLVGTRVDWQLHMADRL